MRDLGFLANVFLIFFGRPSSLCPVLQTKQFDIVQEVHKKIEIFSFVGFKNWTSGRFLINRFNQSVQLGFQNHDYE